MNKIQKKFDVFWNGKLFMPLLLIISLAALAFDFELEAMFLLIALCVLLLVFSDDLMSVVCPVFCILLLSTEFYVDYSEIVPYVPYAALPFALAFLFNLIYYRRPLAKGKQTKALIAVSAALLLGGLGTVSKKDYFLPVSLYYVLGLGLAMLLIYLLAVSRLKNEREYNRGERLAEILYTSGLLAAFVIFVYYIENWSSFAENGHVLFFKPRNYISSVLLMTLPACCMLVEKNRIHVLGFAAMCLALLLAGSRSGLLFGAFIGLVCFVYTAFLHRDSLKNKRTVKLGAISSIVITVLAAIIFVPELYSSRLVDGNFISGGETRVLFIKRGIEDFLRNPVFGVGVGYQGNREIFKAIIPGSLVFYHNVVIQVIASMGIFGVLAYLWLFIKRVKLLVKNLRTELIVFGFSYVGILMMSLTNPGIFCPFPEAALVTLIFAVIETETGKAQSSSQIEKTEECIKQL